MAGMSILGLGHDVVDVEAFAAQLAEPGTRMRALFSVREVRQAAVRAQAKRDGEAVHLAARWAGKEAVLKAWEAALADLPSPYTLDSFPWSCIEILDDSRGRPHVHLADDVTRTLLASLPQTLTSQSSTTSSSLIQPSPTQPSPTTPAARLPIWHISLTHDGPVASAVVILAD